MQKIVNNIKKRIKQSNSIAILSSRPTDPDCITSNLLIKWYIEKNFGKKAQSFIFSSFTTKVKAIPDYKKIKNIEVTDFNESKFDLIVLVDGSDWERFFGSRTEIINEIDKSKYIGVDHHKSSVLKADLKTNFLRLDDSSTAKIIYEHFIKPANLKISNKLATWIYFSIVDDTGNFKHEIFETTFSVANEMFKNGANLDLVVNENHPLDQIKFMSWAIDNSVCLEEIKTIILAIGDEEKDYLDVVFGDNWYKKNLQKYFMEVVFRRVEGFDYGLYFQKDWEKGGVRAGWRTRNVEGMVSIQNVLEEMEFDAGGHFGAGGGYNPKMNILNVVEEFEKVMKQIQK